MISPHCKVQELIILGCEAAEAYNRGCFFSPELVRDHTKIQGNTGGSFIFHQNWFATIPKFREIQECFLFTMNCLFRSDVSFSIDVSFSKCVSFSIDVSFSRGSFFFTRIGSRPYQNFGKHLLKKKQLLKKKYL